MPHHRLIRAAGPIALTVALLAAFAARAAITPTGDVTLGGNTYVGRTATGALAIDGGDSFTSGAAYLGYNRNVAGSVTVTGPGSAWANTYELQVGRAGTGTLVIRDGAQVTGDSATLGYNTDSIGSATVSGPGSSWTTTADWTTSLTVAFFGRGSLTIEDGARVVSRSAGVGAFSSLGTVAVTGPGSAWTVGASPLDGVLGLRAGTMTIAAGGRVTSVTGYVGDRRNTSGAASALVTGSGSAWENTGLLHVGNRSPCTLDVRAGGRVTSATGSIAAAANAVGHVTVTGPGSTWANAADLYVGGAGTATLTVADGGAVTAGSLFASPADLRGDGRITARGAVLDIDLAFDAARGNARILPFGSGGTLDLTFGDGAMGAGFRATGTLRIADGVSADCEAGYLGFAPGSSGAATITGPGSTWAARSTLAIGYEGNGTLRIEAGGRATSPSADIASLTAATGAVTVTGPGSAWATGGALRVGYRGRASLVVADSGHVTAASLSVNDQSALRVHVSGNDMIVLGDAATPGSLTGFSNVTFYADAFLPAGTYTPISELANRPMTWTGAPWHNAVGGTWDPADKAFTVPAATPLAPGAAATITPGQRLLITDPATGRRAGATFGTVPAGTPFAAAPVPAAQLAHLLALLPPGQQVPAAWDITTNLTGPEILLSFDLPPGTPPGDVSIWQLENGTWAPCSPSLLTRDAADLLSFTASSSGAYAVVTPEPTALALLLPLAALALRRLPARHG